MKSIAILAGGSSSEREVSLRSGAAVTAALREKGYDVTTIDPANGLNKALLAESDIIFPVLHGAGGEDGSVQQQLEDWGLAYVGSDVPSSRLCFDKSEYKKKLSAAGLPTPASSLVSSGSVDVQPLFKQPFVLKPYDGGSSVDTFIVRDVAKADWPAIKKALETYGEMLLERLIEGVEITVGVLGEQALPVIEIVPPADGEFDYENKYNGKTQELCPPQHVSEEVQQTARNLAQEIHKLCGCRDFSRTDMIVDAHGQLWVLETNTIPGMTDQSLFPKAAAEAGISMPELVDQLVNLALKR